MLEDISHLLFLAVLLVYQACLQDSDLHILQGVIRLVKMCRYRKVIPAVDHIPTGYEGRCPEGRPGKPTAPRETGDAIYLQARNSGSEWTKPRL